jgi:hypothetical protein
VLRCFCDAQRQRSLYFAMSCETAAAANGLLPALRAASALAPRGLWSDSLLLGGGNGEERLYVACAEAAAVALCIQVRRSCYSR